MSFSPCGGPARSEHHEPQAVTVCASTASIVVSSESLIQGPNITEPWSESFRTANS